jgi:hypothetical protein
MSIHKVLMIYANAVLPMTELAFENCKMFQRFGTLELCQPEVCVL